MSFDMRQSKFAVIWLAATRGIKSLNNKEIESVDISNICEEISKFVVRNDLQLSKRCLSNVSAELMYGAVLVHRQQLVNLQSKIQMKKITRTKNRQELDYVSVNSQAEQIETLRNQQERRLEIANDNVIDKPTNKLTEIPDLFGDEGQINKQLALLSAENFMNNPDFPISKAIVPLLPEAHDSMNIVPEMAPIFEPINILENNPSALETTPRKSKRPIGSPEVEQSPSKRKKQSDVQDDSSIAVHLEAAQPLTPRAVPRAEPQEVEMPPPKRTTPIRQLLCRSQVEIDLNFETPSRLSKIPNENRIVEISDVLPARLYASTPISKNNQFARVVTRRNILLDLIRSLFLNNGNSLIQLKQLCRLLTRFNISTTFSDLLYFHSKQFIALESAPGTIELNNIYPGPKLN